MAEIFTAVCSGILLHILSFSAGFAAGRIFKRQKEVKKGLRTAAQTAAELERIRESQEEYRNIARYDGTVQ